MGLTNYGSDQYLAILNGTNLAAPVGWYLALFTTVPDNTGAGTEVSGNGYARMPITFTTPSSIRTVRNSASILFPTATPDGWGQIVGAAVYDALSGGHMWYQAQLMGVFPYVNPQERLQIPAGSVVVEL